MTLDPKDWNRFRAVAHAMLEAALDKMQSVRDGQVWNPVPDAVKAELQADVPVAGQCADTVAQELAGLLPYGVGNTHPRFFGWVHGAGSPGGVLAEIAAAAMNANVGGRDHGGVYVEKQVLDWCRDIMAFPAGSSGLIVSGTSIATIIAVKCARDTRVGFDSRRAGIGDWRLVGYTSAQAHSCVARAFDLLGLGSDALRKVPCNAAFEMDLGALAQMVTQDRAGGFVPFFVAGTAGTVNVGAIDDLAGLSDFCAAGDLWFHVDGAFGAAAVLSDAVKPRLAGMERAASLAFDFHKWLHVNYDAGCVLIRDGELHRRAFSERPEYLAPATRGLAAGEFWPVDYGPELSRGFRALKVWAHLKEHGTRKLGAEITRNIDQAQYLKRLIDAAPELELLAPVALQIVCFRYGNKDAVNDAIVVELQEQGVAAPSTTRIAGKLAIRVNITNHRTEVADLDLLVREVVRIGRVLVNRAD